LVLLAGTAMCIVVGACVGKSDYGGGLLGLFQPAYIVIEAGPCGLSYSIDGGPSVAVGDGVVVEVSPGPHAVSLGVNGGSCGCGFGPDNGVCQVTARRGRVSTIRTHGVRGALCYCDIIFCYYYTLVVVECSP
jgi:hypothetical protein